MSLKFGISLPQGWMTELASIKDPVAAYEAMTRVAQTADELGVFVRLARRSLLYLSPSNTRNHL